jgi:hypothetical protein
MVLQDLGHFAQALRVLLEVLEVGEGIRAGSQPGAPPRDAGALQTGRQIRQPLQAADEAGVVLPEVDRHAGGAKDEPLGLHLAQQILQLAFAQAAQVIRIRLNRFEAELVRQLDGSELVGGNADRPADQAEGHWVIPGGGGLGGAAGDRSRGESEQRASLDELSSGERVHGLIPDLVDR